MRRVDTLASSVRERKADKVVSMVLGIYCSLSPYNICAFLYKIRNWVQFICCAGARFIKHSFFCTADERGISIGIQCGHFPVLDLFIPGFKNFKSGFKNLLGNITRGFTNDLNLELFILDLTTRKFDYLVKSHKSL